MKLLTRLDSLSKHTLHVLMPSCPLRCELIFVVWASSMSFSASRNPRPLCILLWMGFFYPTQISCLICMLFQDHTIYSNCAHCSPSGQWLFLKGNSQKNKWPILKKWYKEILIFNKKIKGWKFLNFSKCNLRPFMWLESWNAREEI